MRRQPLLFRSTLWNVFTSVLLTAGALLCFGPQAAAQDYLITTAGGALVVTDNVGNSETLDVSENGANIRFNAAGRTYSLDGGPETAMPVDIALAGLTSITVDAAGGDDVIDIGAFAAELPSLTINGGAGGDVVNFNGSITFADGANLNVDLQDDDANPGVDDLTFNSSVALQLQGSGAATIRVSRNIRMNFGAALRTADGDLTVEANQQAAPTTGEFMGLFLIGSTVEVAGAGNLTVKGKNGDAGSFSCGVCLIAGTTLKGGTAGSNTVVQGTGGASTGNFNHGVQLDGASNTITSSGGDVLVEGWGGGSGASSENIGVILRSGGQITAEGMGTVTVRGTGGTSTGNNQYGIRVDGANSTITSSGGEVLVEGWGGGSGASRNNFGVLLISGGQVAGVGMAAVTVRGTGGIGSSGFNYGLSIRGPITSSGGNVLLEGQGGGSGAFTQQNVGVVLDNNSQVMAGGAGTVTILGTGGNSGNGFDNFGIWMNGANSVVTSAGGDVFLEGIGGNVASGGQNIGISMIGEISAGGMGTVTVLGTAGPSGLNNIGIAIAGGGVITSSGGDVSVQGQGGGNDGLELNIGVSVGGTITAGGTGAVTVVGTGGSDVGFSNYGVYVAGPSGIITSSGGDVSVQGQGGSGTSFENHGVIVGEGGQISAGGDGAVAVNGTGGASTGNGNYGVALRGAASVITSSGGDVQVDGQGGGSGASFSNNGVHVDEGQISAGGAGTVTVNGTGGATTDDFNIGVEVRGATGAITSSGGDVLVNGQGGGSGASRSNIGISVGSDGGQITAGGMGSVTVLGVGGASTGNSNFGVSVGGAGAITSSGGDVLVDGQGGGSGASLFNPGIWVSGDGQITAGGIGAVTVLGAGGPSSGIVNHGVYIEAVNAIASSAGPISITGAKGAASTGAADIITTNGGSITSTSTTAGITFDSQDGGLWPNTDGLEVSTSAGQAAVFVAGSKLNIDIDGTTPNTQFQQLTLNGGIDLTGAELTFMGSSHSPAAGQSFLIVDNDGTDPVAGIFDGLPEASFIPNFLSSGLNAFITYRGGDGNDVVLSIFDGLPGDNCSNALDLGALSSPFSGTTAGFNDDTDVSCLNASLDRIFYIDVPAGFELTIGQTSNTYNSQHRVAYGGACPGDTELDCIDDPDTQTTTWANTTGAEQRVWWVQEGSSDGDAGDFTLAWELALAGANVTFCVDIGCLPTPSSVSVAGQFNGFDPSANPMTDPDGDGVYCTTVLLPAGDQEYIFLIDGVEEQLQAGSSCTVTDAGVTNRALTVVAGVAQSATYLFGSCDASLSIPNITFPDIPLSCVGDETVTVTGGATPAGGVYSGPGVTDNGDGTFDVDLSVLDEGDYTITYTLSLALQCTASETATLSVDKDTRAPDIVFPSQDVVATLAPCDIGGTAMVSFDVSVTDDCGGSYIPGDVVVPGSEFTVKVISGPSLPAISSAGGNSFSGAFGPGMYQVQASAEDAAGNPRNEDFLVIVTQDAPPPTDLICDYNVVVRLDDDCERTITPSLVLEGDFGCLTNDDFVVSIVDGQGQSVGNTLDGAGSYIYEVTLAPGVGPVSGFEPCWGYIAGEDKTAPDIDCPDDTDEGALVLECFTESGTLDASDLSMEPLNFSCFIDGGSSGSSIDPGVHYYDLIPFQVDRTDYYTILVSDEFSSIYDETAIALFQGGFNPANPCENIIAFVDEPVDDFNPPLGDDEPYLRLSLPLVAGQVYYLWVTSDEDGATGDYTVDICPDDGASRVGLFSSSVVLNPVTWEPEVVTNDQLWDTREVSLELELFCEDFDLIFNNPASLAITGMPDVDENCGGEPNISFVDTYTSDGDCAPIIITRTFTVTDAAGNASTCTQEIRLDRPDAGDVEFPPRTVPIECDEQFATLPNGNPHPSVTGYPFIVTVSGIFNLADDYCNIGASFVDRARVNVCEGAYKFVRDWTIIDWCEGDNIAEGQQVIKVGDFTAPSVTCPAEVYDWDGVLDPLVFSTSPWSCTASFSVPLPGVTDNCSDYEVHTEIVTDVEVDVTNQYGQVIGTTTETVVVRVIPWNAPTRMVSGIPAGGHAFRYTVEDGCGNKTVVTCPFTVADRVEPTAICDDNLHVSIGGDGFSRIFAADIDEGSNDNCGDVTIEVRRNKFDIVNYTCGAGFSNWGPYVDFFCCDVGVTVTIELRVTDEAGNVNTCWLDIVPEEKARPYCYAPHPVAVDCDDLPYNFDATDTLQLQQLFGDATSDDNCGSYERELPPVPDLECGFGTIIRRFRAVDIHGNESVNFCQQVVTIREVHNYEIHFPADAEAVCGVADPDSVRVNEIGCDLLAISHTDEFFSASGDECYKIFRTWKVINWCQYDGESDPFVVGRDEDCDNMPGDECVYVLHRPGGKTYIDRDDDETEPNNVPLATENPCHGIDDFWRKVDYDGGFFQYTQVIKVYDNIDPEIIATPQDFCSYDNVNCTGLVNLPFTIDENCTPGDLTIKVFLDAGADGTIDFDLQDLTDGAFDDFTLTGTYPDYTLNGRFPIGCHAFEVHVEDGCGNTNSELLDFCVIDCKAPSPVCINGLAIELMPVDLDGDDVPDEGRMAIWANDFVVSPMADCTGPVTYSINRSGDAPNVDSTGITLTCADTGTLVVEIWAYDGEGNSDFCETYILVQDNMNLCGPGPLAVGAAGAINTEEDLAVENVAVSLSGQGSMTVMTGADGAYSFTGLQEGYDYSITPELNANYLNGVSTFDLVLISKHILGVEPLNSPYKMIAADVNNSKSITTLDLIQLRKLILSIDTEFENNTSWRFVEAAYVFPNASNPWFEEFPEVVNINNLPATGISGADFVGVKIGDVNGDADVNALVSIEGRTLAGEFNFAVEEAELKAGGEYTVAFTAADMASIDGYQATLAFDNSALELVDIIPGVATEENFGLTRAGEGLIATSWHQVANSEQRNANTALFSLVFRAKADAQLSELLSVNSRVTKAEAYNTNGEYLGVGVTFSGKAVVGAGFELYQNTPNPFKGETLVGFNLPVDDNVTLTVSDVTGRVLKLIRLDGVKGYNNVVLNSSTLPAAGVLYYTVETSEYTATRKMVIIE